jgi:hypothetical protein
VEVRGDHLEQLALVDRAPVQLEVDRHVRRDRRRGRERRDEAGRGVHDAHELVDVREVPQRLDPSGGRAGADGDEPPGARPDLLDARCVVLGRDGALHERQVVRTLHDTARGLEEVGDLDLPREREQLVLAVEQRELAAVARGELPDRESGLRAHRSRTSSHGAATSKA